MMKKLLPVLTLLLLLNVSSGARTTAPLSAKQAMAMSTRSTLLFAENKGQLADQHGKPRSDALFKASNKGTTVYLNKNGISYQFTKYIYPNGYKLSLDPKDIATQAALTQQIQTQTFAFSLSLQNANPDPVIRKEGKSNFVENFYTSNTPPEGVTNVGNYQRIVYENVYPNIDWVVYSRDQHLKYDFIVHPGGDPSMIRLKIDDANKVSITAAGELLMQTSLGEVREQAPVTYADGVRVSSRFLQNTDGTIGFDVKPLAGKTLTIDPYVVWATYYGGSEQDAMNVMGICATDPSGNVFIGGYTASASGIASGGFQNTYGGGATNDAFLVKLDATGNRLWATYYGGINEDRGQAAATDASGNIYLVGVTASTGLASGGFQNTFGGSVATNAIGDAFLVKFNPSGARIWATYYGGPNDDYGNSCAVDASGNVYMGGQTNSASGISSATGFQPTYGGGVASSGNSGLGDGFLVKFDGSGNRLWATYYGGSESESGYGCAVDATGNVFLTGGTISLTNIASANAFQGSFSGLTSTAYLVKFNSAGNRIWGTYYGNGFSEGWSCAADATGNVYLAGRTSTNNNNIASGGFQNTLGGLQDAFLAKFNVSGNRVWGTYYGGSSDEFGFSTFLDNSGNVYLTGQTQSTNNIASGGIQNTIAGGNDAYIAKFNPAGTRIWGTYYGGSGFDVFTHGTADAFGNLYLGGYTGSTSGVALGGFQNTNGGSLDLLLVKMRELCNPDSVTVTKTTCSNQLPYLWNGISVAAGGVHVAKDTFLNVSGCDSFVYLNLVVNNPAAPVLVYDTICSNQLPFTWNNISVTLPSGNSTTATFTGQTSNGCDSVVTLHLFVKSASANTVTQTICSNQLPYTWNNITVTIGGAAAAVYTTNNAAGCDSVVTLNLTVHNVSYDTVSAAVCSNQMPYVWNGITVAAGGNNVATYTTINAAGCDSIVTLNLTVKNTSSGIVNKTICANELPYSWNGITVTSGGSAAASFTSVNAVGCDSITTLSLTVTPTVLPAINITANPGTNVPLGTAVTYTATVTNGGATPVLQWIKNGVNVGSNSASYLDLNVDSGDVITCVLHSNATCVFPDTSMSNIITMNVVTPPPPCLVPVTLISTDIQFTSAIFKWAGVTNAVGYEIALDMMPGNPSSGMFTTDTLYHASALLPGVHYFHIRSRCANNLYSDWITITITIQDDNNGATGTVNLNGSADGIALYPNPNNGVFNVTGIVADNKSGIDIVDKAGRIVYHNEAQSPAGKLNVHVDVSGRLTAGVYLLRVTSGYHVYVLRFVAK